MKSKPQKRFTTPQRTIVGYCAQLLFITCFPLSNTHAFQVTTEPQLRIEAINHTQQINRIGVNRDCTRLLTGSNDKTARLWTITSDNKSGSSFKNPRLLRVFRPPTNPGTNVGEIHAVALHPDGLLAAISGYTPSDIDGYWAIYIFDVNSSEIIGVVPDNPYRVTHLTFSDDGKYLAATMRDGFGIRVWEAGKWDAPIAEDSEKYGSSYGASFDSEGRLYSVAWNEAHDANSPGWLRRYQPNNYRLEGELKRKIPGGERPYNVAVHPSGKQVAVSQLSTPVVTLFEVSPDRIALHAKQPQIAGISCGTNGSCGLGKMTWSSDGNFLFAGGSYSKNGRYQVRVWPDKGQGEPFDVPVSQKFVAHLSPCREGVIVATRDPSFGLMDSSGKFSNWQGAATVQMQHARRGGLRVSPDGTRISFPNFDGDKSSIFVFDVRNQRMLIRQHHEPELLESDTNSLPITNWNKSVLSTCAAGTACRPVDPLFNGDSIAPMLPDDREESYRAKNDEEWVSLAIAPDKEHFVMGTEWRLRGYKKGDFRSPMWSIPTHGTAWSINISRESNLVIVAYDDGTIRWYTLAEGKELLALFVHAIDHRWITWTPGGYFHAEAGGEDLLGWHMNNGPIKAAHFFPVSLYRDTDSRIDVMKTVLIDQDVNKAVVKSNKNRKLLKRLNDNIEPMPIVKIHSHGPEVDFDNPEKTIKIEFSIDLPSGPTLANVSVLIDGIEQRTFTNKSPSELLSGLSSRIKLPGKDSQVTVYVVASRIGKRSLTASESVRFKYTGPEIEMPLPKLFGLAVGVADTYADEDKLDVADKDATDFVAALISQKGKAFSRVSVKPIINKYAKAANIKSELDAIRKKVKQANDPFAITLFFYSGHGVVDRGGRFYLMPTELEVPDHLVAKNVSKQDYLELYGVSQDDLFHRLKQIPGRKILVFDACRSGIVNSAQFINAVQANTMLSAIAFTSTRSGELAIECKNNGCFTKALLEAFSEGLAGNRFEPVWSTSTEELKLYLRETVPTYSKSQHPTAILSDGVIAHFELSRH